MTHADPPWLLPSIPADQVDAAEARLPQMYPVKTGEWLRLDAAWGAQIAEKARLIAERRADLIAVLPGAEEAAEELLDLVLADLPLHGFAVGEGVMRPDGVTVPIRRDDPLGTIATLIQEDVCIHQKQGDEHVLTAAQVCFPSSWTLAEKIGRPLTRIHLPVTKYDEGIAARVQRMFDMVGTDRVLWRANLLRHHDPALFHAYTEANPRPPGRPDSPYLRSERQTLRRLPRTGAVVFTIHTSLARS